LDWFKNWFDSFYYHKLYRHRNTAEAQQFMDNILDFINPPKDNRILDLACGKGRHSIYLNKKGFDVVGVDLSKNSIAEANKQANPHLHFHAMDMRHLVTDQPFDLVMNLFTSFGYFKTRDENLMVLNGVNQILNSKGILVIDFLNATKVIKNLVPEEIQQIEDITFTINRFIENDTVVKTIQVNHEGKNHEFQESVSMFELSDFKAMFNETGFNLIHHFGNYQLNDFDPKISDRLILVAQKKD
jgi:SAM-dependent methyltransferase